MEERFVSCQKARPGYEPCGWAAAPPEGSLQQFQFRDESEESLSADTNQPANALGNRFWKSSRPTHWGVIVMRTIEEIIVRSWLTQACPCSVPK